MPDRFIINTWKISGPLDDADDTSEAWFPAGVIMELFVAFNELRNTKRTNWINICFWVIGIILLKVEDSCPDRIPTQ